MTKKVLVPIVVAVAAAAATSASAQPPTSAATGVVATIQDVCLPVLRGGNFKQAARAAGFKQANGAWVLTMSDDRRIQVQPPGHANPHLCSATVTSLAANVAAVRGAVAAWAGQQSPQLTPIQVDVTVPGLTSGWSTSSWSAQTPAGDEAVALGQQSPGAAPAPGALSQSNLEVTLTPTAPT